LCGDGRQRAAPLCVCPADGFSACVRCAAAWFAARSGETTWVGPSGRLEGPSELEARFEAAAGAARYAAPLTGFAGLDPSQLDGWVSGPWASGGGGAATSPFVAYAVLAAVAGTADAGQADPAASAAAFAHALGLEEDRAKTVLESLRKETKTLESKLKTVLAEMQTAKTALSDAQKQNTGGIACAFCTFVNEPGSAGGGVVCTVCDSPLPEPADLAAATALASKKDTEFGAALKCVKDNNAASKAAVEQLSTLQNAAARSGVAELGGAAGLAPLVAPGGAVDRFAWSLPFLLRRLDCGGVGADGRRLGLPIGGADSPGWQLVPVVTPASPAPAAAAAAATAQPDDADEGAAAEHAHSAPAAALAAAPAAAAALVPAAVAAHRVFAAVEALRAAASGLPAKPLLSSYFARGESLAAAVEACCWLGVEACLGAGAPATLVSVPVAMKLLHACAARGSGPAAGYAPRSPGCPLRTDCVAASSGPGSGSGGAGFCVAPFPGVAPLGLPLLGGDPLALPAGRDVALLRALLAAGASAKEDAEGEVPLVTALWLGRLDYLALVAGHNPDPNLRDLVRTGHKLAAPFNLSLSHTLRAFFFF
jgi:hypothetical protein